MDRELFNFPTGSADHVHIYIYMYDNVYNIYNIYSTVYPIGTEHTKLSSYYTRESKARTGRFLREKLMSDHGHFSSYEGHKER